MTTTIFATVQAKPEHIGAVDAALRNMVLPTRAEAGCVKYDLYQSKEDATNYHLLETYDDDEALARHHQSSHFAELVASLTDKLAANIQIKRIGAIDIH